ncbi:MAG TPA: transcription-repair coupling factor [Candidatus Acidoferrum sp.]|nr:transcription-repair coupling factor [Candidatus Acidoferrum sp.]
MILPQVSELFARVARHPAFEEALDSVRRSGSDIRLGGLTDTAKALAISLSASELGRPLVVFFESDQRAESFLDPVRYFYRAVTGKPGRRVAWFPSLGVLPYDERSPHAEISEARAVSLWRFSNGEADVLLMPVQAGVWRLREPAFYRQLARTIARDQCIAQEDLLGYLVSAGYDKQLTCEMAGQFAVRGGIIDVFSPESSQPIRIELFGDTVESIRAFDPNTQRSTSPIERATLIPLTEFPRGVAAQVTAAARGVDGRAVEALREDTESIGGLFPGWEFREALRETRNSVLLDLVADPVVLEDEPSALSEALEKFRAEMAEAFEQSDDPLAEPPERFILSQEEWSLSREMAPRLGIERLTLGDSSGQAAPILQTQPTTRYRGNVAALMAEVRGRISSGESVMISASSTGELERFADICHEYEVPYRVGELEENTTVTRLAEEGTSGNTPAVILIKAPLAEGVVFGDARLAVHGNSDLFETLPAPAERARARPKSASFFSDFSDLKPGDYVVHVDHGIGQFEGLRQVTVEGAAGEFMLLRYFGDARLYVPLARLDLVQKYQSLGGEEPQLDRLGVGAWEARKSRVRKSVTDMADQLLALYAERKTAAGHAFPPDSNFQHEFEDAFEFEPTVDQKSAIEDVKRDMESTLPMDRLLCGDVGYGKTEVAMRAAFKAISDSKQVAVLAPTTVLAFQHYETFRRRFAAFPARIEMLSRFRSATEQKKTIEELEAGKVDIVIGTHRILSKDVKFADLGVLIVDEEQRFGVAHKERLKELRKNVDVLTMSATPIPRTLHMSLVGLRDMSLIETPPKDRLAIQTTVAPFSETLVQRVIGEELTRGGQVFFVHNRVESIASLATLIQRLLPKARVVVGHGQMKESELEKVMLKFIRHEADILVSTTIVENGLDIPAANTIIINRADRMGLAELYQLRGRVGRSNVRAFAYLLIPPDAPLTPIARTRLAALKEFSDLGAGFRIAALDLELRGAGNILGSQQHGHIEAVGFDLYIQMLERAVNERRGQAVAPERRATLNLGLDIRIPPEYIDNENLRLRIYKRIAGIATEAQHAEVSRELADRFGPPPPSVETLLDYSVLKAIAEKLLVASVDRRNDQVAVKFYDDTPIGPEKVVKLVRKRPDLRLDPTGILWVNWKAGQGGPMGAVRNVLLQLQA